MAAEMPRGEQALQEEGKGRAGSRQKLQAFSLIQKREVEGGTEKADVGSGHTHFPPPACRTGAGTQLSTPGAATTCCRGGARLPGRGTTTPPQTKAGAEAAPSLPVRATAGKLGTSLQRNRPRGWFRRAAARWRQKPSAGSAQRLMQPGGLNDGVKALNFKVRLLYSP